MKRLEKVLTVDGLTIYRERGDAFLDSLFSDGPTVTFYARFGEVTVRQETYLRVRDEQRALDRFMELLDYYTLPEICAAFSSWDRSVSESSGGALLSGEFKDGSTVCFRRVENTPYYRHSVTRPQA